MRIVVRLPNWLGDIVMSFSFLQALRKEFKEAEIHVILPPAYIELPKLLDLDLIIHPFFSKKLKFFKKIKILNQVKMLQKLKYFWGLKSFCNSLNSLDNSPIDIYFTLPNSFSSALMGLLLQAKLKVGYYAEGRGIFLNRRIKQNPLCHRYQDYLALLTAVTKNSYSFMCNKISLEPFTTTTLTSTNTQPPEPSTRSSEPTTLSSYESVSSPDYLNPGSYIVINVNSEKDTSRWPLVKWTSFLNCLPPSNLVFIGTLAEQVLVEKVIISVKQSQKNNNHKITNLAGKTTIYHLAQILSHAKLVISNDSGPSHLAAYLGAPIVSITGAADINKTGLISVQNNTKNIRKELPCSPCVKNICPVGTLECLNSITNDEIVTSMQSLSNKSETLSDQPTAPLPNTNSPGDTR